MSNTETRSQKVCKGDPAAIVAKLFCMPDLKRDFTWDEVDGVRVPVSIVFTSAQLDADTGQTNVLTRNFVYEVADPFDLDYIEDELVVT